RIGSDVREVGEGIVLLRVAPTRRPEIARRRETLRVRLPRTARFLDRVGETLPRGDAGRAIARDPVRRAGDQGEIVRQARMCHTEVARQARVTPGVVVERGGRGISQDTG